MNLCSRTSRFRVSIWCLIRLLMIFFVCLPDSWKSWMYHDGMLFFLSFSSICWKELLNPIFKSKVQSMLMLRDNLSEYLSLFFFSINQIKLHKNRSGCNCLRLAFNIGTKNELFRFFFFTHLMRFRTANTERRSMCDGQRWRTLIHRTTWLNFMFFANYWLNTTTNVAVCRWSQAADASRTRRQRDRHRW